MCRVILVSAVSASVAGIVYAAVQGNVSCDMRHVDLLAGMEDYERTLDPDLCYSLTEDMDLFNEECEIRLGPIDCG